MFSKVLNVCKEVEKDFNEVKLFKNFIDATTELCFTVIEVVFLHTYMKIENIKSAF